MSSKDRFHHFDDSHPQAGIPEFLEPMADALPALSSHIEVMEDGQMSFLMILEKGHQSELVAYLIGSTWLNFGRY